MKKFILTLVAVFAAMSVNAAVYLVGNYDIYDMEDTWDPTNPAVLSRTSRGWETTLNIQTFKISTSYGDWYSFDENALTVSNPIISKSLIGSKLPLMPLTDDLNFDLPWRGDWTICVSADYSTITLTTTTPEPTNIPVAYVMGEMSEWIANDMWRMTTRDGGKTYTFECRGETAIEAGVEFKIGTENWAGINYSVGDGINPSYSPYEVEYNMIPPQNMWFNETFVGTIKLELINGPYNYAYLSFIRNTNPTPDVPTTGSLYACGNWENGWDPRTPKVFGINSAGDYELTIEEVQKFRISTSMLADADEEQESWDVFNQGSVAYPAGDIKKNQVNVKLPLEYGEQDNILPWPGCWTIKVSKDLTTMTVSNNTPMPEGYLDAYIVGTMTDWTFLPEWKMTTTDGVKYEFVVERDNPIKALVEFKVADSNYAKINYSVSGGIRGFGESYYADFNSFSNMWFEDDFFGKIELDLVNGQGREAELTFTYGEFSGIDEVEADEAGEHEYYNLQGIRVAAPAEGEIYIVRKGGKFVKVKK